MGTCFSSSELQSSSRSVQPRCVMSDVYNRVQTELVASGKYKEIYNLLEVELRNCGWYDSFLQVTENTIQSADDRDLQLGKILNQVQEKGINTVPEEVKVKILKKIAEFLDNIVE